MTAGIALLTAVAVLVSVALQLHAKTLWVALAGSVIASLLTQIAAALIAGLLITHPLIAPTRTSTIVIVVGDVLIAILVYFVVRALRRNSFHRGGQRHV